MPKPISERRRATYYVGLILMIVGGISFASVLILAVHTGDFSDFDARGKSMAFCAFGGVALIVLGGIIEVILSCGLVGSGIVLDRETACEDLKPYAGIAKDALDEAGIAIGGKGPERVIMVKCQACGKKM